jgi:hypothetical protein
MAIRGKLAVDIQFADTHASGDVSSVKTVAVQNASEYTTGKVVTVSGTCGTSAVTIAVAPSTYKDSTGSVVSLAAVDWFAFRSSVLARCDEVTGDGVAVSAGDLLAVSVANGGTAGFEVYSDSGTASYTLVVYGS